MVKISQSLLKAYVDYLQNKECGLLFNAKYIVKDPEAETPPTDAMKLGIYFEYLCTGALPKNGKVPEPEMAYKGTARERLSVDYERVQQSAEVFKSIIKHYDIKILQVGMALETQSPAMSGVIDIFAEWDGQKVFIDTKYTGLIDDKWSETGWDLESLPIKDSLMVQGVQYKILAQKCLGIEDIPFYYFVFSSKNPKDVKIIKQTVDESRIAAHLLAVGNTAERLRNDIKNGFAALPSLKKCSECPIAHKCPSKVDYPLVDEVYY